MLRTLESLSAGNTGSQSVDCLEENIDMVDEFLRHDDSFNVGAITDVEQHFRYTARRGLFEAGQDAPDSKHALLDSVLLFADAVAFLIRHVDIDLGTLKLLAPGSQPDVPELVDHVAFRVPVLVGTISEKLDKLLQDGSLAAVAPLGKLRGIVIVTIDLPVVFVVAVLCTKDRRANRAGKMLNVIFSIQGGDVGPAQSAITLVTQQPEPAKIVSLAEGILATAILPVDGKEFGSDIGATILSR